ncbi:pleckstrin homology domain-containing family G member 4B-like, partial [Eucyclogobius newberryi]|uniref:pleckstrin homology domain-containing family G member 4B-like n=1 Tax=Eucyclogobius newberryi TaxID=166745 RepID=UPI003B5AA6DC
MDVVSSLKSLNKSVESCELSAALGGTFAFRLQDWLQLHQRMVSFTSDLKAAEGLLQRAIQTVEGTQKLDTAQEVSRSVEQQRSLMLEVLKDPGLMKLQREGGSVLAQVRKDQPRFPRSHDYRNWLESASLLYNSVEEKLHSLVMKSNVSLQRLECLLSLRQAENCVCETGGWLSSEAEQVLKESWPSEETLTAAEEALHSFTVFMGVAREKQESSSKLMKSAVKILQSTAEPGPTTEVLQTLVNTFQSNMADFMVRAERRRRDLDTLVQVHSFCQQASRFADECGQSLSRLDPGSPPADLAPQIHMYRAKLGAEFCASRFQSVKSLIPSLTPGAAYAWNAAWERRQKLQLLLDAAHVEGRNGDACQTSAEGRGGRESGGGLCEELESGGQKSRAHCSEADLASRGAEPPAHKQLGRSLSEGAKFMAKLSLWSEFSPAAASQKPPGEERAQPGRKLSLPCNGTQGYGRGGANAEAGAGPKGPLENHGPAQNDATSAQRLTCILSELLTTEREYVRALGFVREQYCPELDRPDVPQELRGQKGAVFSNLEKIHDFHRHHFLPDLERCVDQPIRVGRCFLRHV